MANKQRSVRLPEDVWVWIANLPERYGTDDTEKLKSVLLRGKEMIIKESPFYSGDISDQPDIDIRKQAT